MEFNLQKAGVWVRKHPGQPLNSATRSTAGGWIEISGNVRGQVTLSATRETSRLTPTEGRRRGKIVPGDSAGSGSIAYGKTEAADPISSFFNEVEASLDGLFQIVINERKVGNAPTASATTPQYATSAIMTTLDVWGPGGAETAIGNIAFDIDHDYGVYTS